MLCVATPALAGEVLDGTAFRALAEGRVLAYTFQGLPFGDEEYFPGGAVIWKPAWGACEHGRWYPAGEEICFIYEGGLSPVCWLFTREGDTVAAVGADVPEDEPILLAGQSEGPLDCPGPKVGS